MQSTKSLSQPVHQSPSAPVVLSVHALSDSFKSAIRETVGQAPAHISLSAVRPKGTRGGLRYLLEQRPGAVFVVVEEPEEIVMLPIITLASLFIRAPRRFVIYPDRHVKRVSSLSLVRSVVSVIVGSLAAAKNGVVAFLELALLERAGKPAPRLTRDTRVVYLNTNVNFGVKAGGSLGHIAGVVNDLNRRGVDLVYVATRKFSVIDDAVPLKKLRIPALLGIPMDLFLFGFGQQAYRQVRGLFDSGKPSLIYQRMSRCDYTGAKLSKRHGVPFVIEYNGSEAWGARHWGHRMIFERLGRKAELISLRSAHLVVTISEVLADELVGVGIPRSDIVVYPNCVDPSLFDSSRFDSSEVRAIRADSGIAGDAIVLGFIGTFGRWHGVDVLCEAIRIIARERPEWLDRHNVRFLIVGDGYHGRFVDEIAKDEATRKYVVWPGLVEQRQAPAYLAAMDILLSPHVRNPDGSRFFGSPTKLFEYMSMSRPIVASRLEQLEQVLSPSLSANQLPSSLPGPGENSLAILAEPGDARDLLRGIEFLVERPEWRDTLARNARREVLEKYQWRHHVSKILEGIRSIAERGPHDSAAQVAVTRPAGFWNESPASATEGVAFFSGHERRYADQGDASA